MLLKASTAASLRLGRAVCGLVEALAPTEGCCSGKDLLTTGAIWLSRCGGFTWDGAGSGSPLSRADHDGWGLIYTFSVLSVFFIVVAAVTPFTHFPLLSDIQTTSFFYGTLFPDHPNTRGTTIRPIHSFTGYKERQNFPGLHYGPFDT